MSELHDIRPNWMKLNPEIDHFDPFEGIGKLQENEVRHLRYGINVCEQNLLFDKAILCEATINKNVYPIPNVPSWLNGMINLRGNIIPVFTLDGFLAKDRETNINHKVVFVIGEGSSAVGVLINKLPTAVEIDEEKINAVPAPADTPEIFSDCVNVAYEVDGKFWLEIDINAVIENIKISNQDKP